MKKTNKTRNGILSILLILAILASGLTMMGCTEVHVSSQAELFSAIENGDSVIVLESNITVTRTLVALKTVTIDLNGYWIKNSGRGYAIEVVQNFFTVKDSKGGGFIQGQGGVFVSNSAWLTDYSNAGDFTLESGTIQATSSGYSAVLVHDGNRGNSQNQEVGEFRFNGGKIQITDKKNYGGHVLHINGGSAYITGGTIPHSYQSIVIVKGWLKITGGDISDPFNAITCSGGNVSVDGGTVGQINVKNGNVLLRGGTIGNVFIDGGSTTLTSIKKGVSPSTQDIWWRGGKLELSAGNSTGLMYDDNLLKPKKGTTQYDANIKLLLRITSLDLALLTATKSIPAVAITAGVVAFLEPSESGEYWHCSNINSK